LTEREAIELIRPALHADDGGVWADFGAGSGTFTRALASLLGENAEVIAVERDPAALRDLRRAAALPGGAAIKVIDGDVTNLHLIDEFATSQLDGALFANVLHFLRDAESVLDRLRSFMHPDSRVVVVEYDQRSASRWVPYPLPSHRLAALAASAGLSPPVEFGRRKSRYQGDLYCAAMNWV
jgi:precorrin-6B methylase 2